MKSGDIAERWKEHFEELLNVVVVQKLSKMPCKTLNENGDREDCMPIERGMYANMKQQDHDFWWNC